MKLGTKTLDRGQVRSKKRRKGKRHKRRETRGRKGMDRGKEYRNRWPGQVFLSVLGERTLGWDPAQGLWLLWLEEKQACACVSSEEEREGARSGVFTHLYKAERLWGERVCSEGRPGTSTATSSRRRTISCG